MINRIRDVRKQKGMTLAEVGAACDPPTTAQTIGRLETGMRNLSLDWMNRIAGALGVPVWTLLPTAPNWRWMLHRDDTPWYPTMRLFRQRQAGVWTPVIERVARELRAFKKL